MHAFAEVLYICGADALNSSQEVTRYIIIYLRWNFRKAWTRSQWLIYFRIDYLNRVQIFQRYRIPRSRIAYTFCNGSDFVPDRNEDRQSSYGERFYRREMRMVFRNELLSENHRVYPHWMRTDMEKAKLFWYGGAGNWKIKYGYPKRDFFQNSSENNNRVVKLKAKILQTAENQFCSITTGTGIREDGITSLEIQQTAALDKKMAQDGNASFDLFCGTWHQSGARNPVMSWVV